MSREYLIWVYGLVFVLFAWLFLSSVPVMGQTIGDVWIEDVSPPLFPEYEDQGFAGRVYQFQNTSYMTIPHVFEVLPATSIRGASGFVSLVDGNNETTVIYALGTVDSVTTAIPHVLIGSVTTDLKWFPMLDVDTLTVNIASDSSSSSEQSTIYQLSGVTAEDSPVWTHELPEDIRIDRDWEPFGGTMGGFSFKPGIAPGDYPGEDGYLYLTVLTGTISAGTTWELLYKSSATAGHISTPTGQSPDIPIRYLEQGGLGWR